MCMCAMCVRERGCATEHSCMHAPLSNCKILLPPSFFFLCCKSRHVPAHHEREKHTQPTNAAFFCCILVSNGMCAHVHVRKCCPPFQSRIFMGAQMSTCFAVDMQSMLQKEGGSACARARGVLARAWQCVRHVRAPLISCTYGPSCKEASAALHTCLCRKGARVFGTRGGTDVFFRVTSFFSVTNCVGRVCVGCWLCGLLAVWVAGCVGRLWYTCAGLLCGFTRTVLATWNYSTSTQLPSPSCCTRFTVPLFGNILRMSPIGEETIRITSISNFL